MNIKEILEKMDEAEELTIEEAKDILQKEDKLDDDDEVKEKTLTTMYNEYKCFGTNYDVVMRGDKFRNFVIDMCKQFAQALPDKFEYYFNSDELYEDTMENPVILVQAQQFMKKLDMDIDDIVENFEPTFGGCYLITLS